MPPNHNNFNFSFVLVLNKNALTRPPKNPQFPGVFFPLFSLYAQKSQKQSHRLAKLIYYKTPDKWNLTILQYLPEFRPVWNTWRSLLSRWEAPVEESTIQRHLLWSNTALSSAAKRRGLCSPKVNKLVSGYNNWGYHNILKAHFLILIYMDGTLHDYSSDGEDKD